MVDVTIPFVDTIQVGEPDGQEHKHDDRFSLGSPAANTYDVLAGHNRQQVCDEARRMAEITIPSVAPPLNYRTGDWLPGTNQSIAAGAINNLASKIMFMAFPPGQPMLRLVLQVQKLSKQIAQDPDLYARIELALSQVELAHRKAAAAIGLAAAWVGYMKLLLVSGNALWKHTTLEAPTYHALDYWACSRDVGGHPLLTILKLPVRVSTLDEDVQEQIYAETPELLKQEEWSRETHIYSVCRLQRERSKDSNDWHWQYWEETEKGQLIEGSETDTDYDDCPMWPGWMIPVYGQNYGRSYCEEYRGDFYILEAHSSSLNDGAAQASLALTFVKPGARTSLKQVEKARNLSFLSGSAEDLSVFRADKQADFQFVAQNLDKAERRINEAFLKTSSIVRQGERVTAEEVSRMGADLDQAMGGLYTQVAQGHQSVMVKRFVHLHNEANDEMPALPPGLVKTEVVTGVDALGRSAEEGNLKDFAHDIAAVFPQQAGQVLVATDYALRLASMKGIKPDGLVQDPQVIAQQKQQEQQQAMQSQAAVNAAGPAAGQMAKAMADRMPPGAAGSPTAVAAQPSPQQGAQPNGA